MVPRSGVMACTDCQTSQELVVTEAGLRELAESHVRDTGHVVLAWHSVEARYSL